MSGEPPSTQATAPQRRISIHERIGRGGFGAVFKADIVGSNGFKRTVAVKIVHPGTPAAGLRKLRDEARMLAIVRHRAIVQVDDLLEFDGRPAIVMEYVDGIGLNRVLASHRLPTGPALEILSELASALHAAYTAEDEHGKPLHLVHRDIKPGNILIVADGSVKLLDFGIAKARFDGREGHTTELGHGTAGYVSPERLDDDDHPLGDVFALGVVLAEMLIGKRLGRTSARRSRHGLWVEDAVGALVAAEVEPDVIDLFKTLVEFEPRLRPGLRDVERACLALRTGETLRDWAEKHLVDLPPATDEDTAGTMLESDPWGLDTNDSADSLAKTPRARPDRRRRTTAPRSVAITALTIAIIAVLAVVAGALSGPHAAPPVPTFAATADAHDVRPVPPPSAVVVAPVPTRAPAVEVAPQPIPERRVAAGTEAAQARPRWMPDESTPIPVVEAPPTPPLPAVTETIELPASSMKVTGASSAVVVVEGERHSLPGVIPSGDYAVSVAFADGVSAVIPVRVPPGSVLTLACDGTTHGCAVR